MVTMVIRVVVPVVVVPTVPAAVGMTVTREGVVVGTAALPVPPTMAVGIKWHMVLMAVFLIAMHYTRRAILSFCVDILHLVRVLFIFLAVSRRLFFGHCSSFFFLSIAIYVEPPSCSFSSSSTNTLSDSPGTA